MRNHSVTFNSASFSPEITFHALGDSTRLAVLGLLRERPQSVGEIVSAFPISRPAISKHLRQARETGNINDAGTDRLRNNRNSVRGTKPKPQLPLEGKS